MMLFRWFWWRVRLAVGWVLKRSGDVVCQSGWDLIDRAAIDYDAAFRRYERERRQPEPNQD
jgi:hypothetical protein